MPVRVGTHRAILRIILENCLEVRHIAVNVILKRNDNALVGILQKRAVVKAGVENEVGKRLRVRHRERDFVAPLVSLHCRPLDFDVRLFLQSLENRAIVRVRFRVCRITRQARNCRLFGKRKHERRDVHFLHLAAVERNFVLAAATR